MLTIVNGRAILLTQKEDVKIAKSREITRTSERILRLLETNSKAKMKPISRHFSFDF